MIKIGDELDNLIYREGMDNTYEIYDIKVTSERRKGKGRKLIEEMIKQTNPRIIYAFTRESNKLGRVFYKVMGFKEILIPNFYKEENAIMILYENSLYR